MEYYHTGVSRNLFFFFFNDTATTEIYTLSLHDALPISDLSPGSLAKRPSRVPLRLFSVSRLTLTRTVGRRWPLVSVALCTLMTSVKGCVRSKCFPCRDLRNSR